MYSLNKVLTCINIYTVQLSNYVFLVFFQVVLVVPKHFLAVIIWTEEFSKANYSLTVLIHLLHCYIIPWYELYTLFDKFIFFFRYKEPSLSCKPSTKRSAEREALCWQNTPMVIILILNLCCINMITISFCYQFFFLSSAF